MQFKFSKDGCAVTTNSAKGTNSMKFGWENWFVNKDTVPYTFLLPGRIHMPSKMAGTATWINENTLQLNARFVETMHGDKITCSFDGDKVNVSFLNSVSENSKTDMEKRKPLTGKI